MARGTSEATQQLDKYIVHVVNQYDVIGVRQLFYQLVSYGFPKTEATYKKIINRVVKLRQDRTIPWYKIEDAGRTPLVWDTRSVEEKVAALGNVSVDYWETQPMAVEMWIEKAGLVGVIQGTCSEFRVPVMATRGFPSWSVLYQTANRIMTDENNRNLTILYAGDYDASGMGISDALEEQLTEALEVVGATKGFQSWGLPQIFVERIALTPEQITQFNLPERPHKSSDSRTANFVARTGAEGAVELDALNPNDLNTLIRYEIEAKIEEPAAWSKLKEMEVTEKKVAQTMAQDAAKLVNGIRERVLSA
jgi:hypothetical protein